MPDNQMSSNKPPAIGRQCEMCTIIIRHAMPLTSSAYLINKGHVGTSVNLLEFANGRKTHTKNVITNTKHLI